MFSMMSLTAYRRFRTWFKMSRKPLFLNESIIIVMLLGCLLLVPVSSKVEKKNACPDSAQDDDKDSVQAQSARKGFRLAAAVDSLKDTVQRQAKVAVQVLRGDDDDGESQQEQTVDGGDSQFEAAVRALLEAERRQEQAYAAEDSEISRMGTSPDQLRRFRTSKRSSVALGRSHRINVIKAMAALQTNTPNIVLPSTPIEEEECDPKEPYRRADGSCNNLRHTTWGKAGIPMKRWLRPEYSDGIAAPRTQSVTKKELPSARLISTTVHPPSSTNTVRSGFTHILMQWGQFLDHDLTRTPGQELLDGPYDVSVACCDKEGNIPYNRPQCFSIEIPKKDRFFKNRCMNFVRSIQVGNAKGRPVPVEQRNEITAAIDGSQVYGSSEEEQKSLRTMNMGQLKQLDNLLPEDSSESADCLTNQPPLRCFKAGDDRVNENPTLQSMHTIFMREHNRIAKELQALNPHWGDERIFQESRKIVGAVMQKITYGDYLPLVVGPWAMLRHRLRLGRTGYVNIYRKWIDPSIRNAFATAALRMGHSMIGDTLSSYSTSYNHLGEDILSTVFGNTVGILSSTGKVGRLCRGLVVDPVQNVDRMFSKQITDLLFPDPDGRSMDLVALNIQRGRDHGLPAYSKWRDFCRIRPRLKSFADLRKTHSEESIKQLQSVYAHVEDIDLFPAAMAENSVRGGMVGPTFACLLGQQFSNLRRGDRMWFEEDNDFVKFTLPQLAEIRKASLSRVICDNTDTETIQKDAFKDGERVPCDSIDTVNLNPWWDKPEK